MRWDLKNKSTLFKFYFGWMMRKYLFIIWGEGGTPRAFDLLPPLFFEIKDLSTFHTRETTQY